MNSSCIATTLEKAPALMSNSDRTLITVATYNEVENLPRLTEEIFRYLPEADLLVIDDNSPDGTGQWCDRQAENDPRVHCLHRPGKLGLGTATMAGMKYAIEHGYQYVVNMDADFSHHPRYLTGISGRHDPPAGEPAIDVMIGSRMCRAAARRLAAEAAFDEPRRESLRPFAAVA